MIAAAKTDDLCIGPQPGPQTDFLSTSADIALYGGGAGGGKSFALLLEPLRHIHNPKFGAVCFRRNATQVRNEGGLWHESMSIYAPMLAHPREAFLEWGFVSKAKVKFSHLEYDKSVYDHQGSQIPLIMFDELTHFTEFQFFYMLSRNRSTSGVAGYIRATCNPDADSWVRKLVDWYIGDDGYPIQERSGKIRWFVRLNGNMYWDDTRELLMKRFPGELPKSFTFIPAKVYDNKILLAKDPAYLANLKALNTVDRARLLGGNWNIRANAGTMFRREWFQIVDAIPGGWRDIVRFWDRAATKPHEGNKDPDWTRGLKLYAYPNGTFIVADLKSMRDTPGQVEQFILTVASHDSHAVKVMSQTDPGSAGKSEAEHFVRMLAGYVVKTTPMSKDKLTRAKPVSAQAEAGTIKVLRGPWNDEFFNELENFGEDSDGHDDIVDTLSGSFNELAGKRSIFNVL